MYSIKKWLCCCCIFCFGQKYELEKNQWGQLERFQDYWPDQTFLYFLTTQAICVIPWGQTHHTPHTNVFLDLQTNHFSLMHTGKKKKTHHFIFHNPKDYDIDPGPRKSFLHIKSIRPLTKPRKQANANEPQSGHSSPLRPLSAGKWLCFHREEN